ANNTLEPSANGVTGLLDGFQVADLAAEYKFLKNYNLRAGINNLTNEMFATRRATGYPGPGILPGEGRTFFLSVGAKF
ncbi:TonB-dependent receptor, partial [Arthrospira platensis SPKY1]|nr:TonB-dependent receptor [Arthrospira platensis SPKY1]